LLWRRILLSLSAAVGMAVEAGSTVEAVVVFTAVVEVGSGATSAVAGGRMAADSRRAPMAGRRIEVRWALDRLQVRNRARALAQAWLAGVSVARGDHRELAMPSRTASGTRLETLAAA
jgi:hypothetical protein